jgi:hypothetical protein
MKTILLIIILFLNVFAFSQKNEYADQYIGWKKIYNFSGVRKGQQVDDKFYTPLQISYCDSIANWMQASYTPKGGLGDVKKTVLEKIGLYNSYNKALPQSYGAVAYTYLFLKKDAKGNWTNETSHAILWKVMANEVPEYLIHDMTTENQYYFTIPGMDEELVKQNGTNEFQYKKLYDLSSHKMIGKYINMVIPEFGDNQRRNVVILSKDNKFPFRQLSIGEVLNVIEKTLPIKLEEEKKKITERTQGNQKDYDFYFNSEKAKHDKAKVTLTKLREKYKNRFGELAYLNSGDFNIIDLSNGSDIFAGYKVEENGIIKKTYPVYGVVPEMQALCKTDKPQWIYISWVGGSLQEPVFQHMHESIINNFDFDYVYNFFFAPEKVKGKNYKPLRSPKFEEESNVKEVSDKSKTIAKDEKVIFFDDFSNTSAGKTPLNWISNNNSSAQKAVVENPKNNKENWVKIQGNSIRAKTISPFPENFSLSYDVAVPKGFEWGGKRLSLKIGKEKKSFLVEIRPGYDGSNGFLHVNVDDFGSEILNTTANSFGKDFPAIGFSNNKDFNQVSIKIQKTGKDLELFIDNQSVVKYKEAFYTSAFTLEGLEFNHSNSDSDNQKYYISNLKVEK